MKMWSARINFGRGKKAGEEIVKIDIDIGDGYFPEHELSVPAIHAIALYAYIWEHQGALKKYTMDFLEKNVGDDPFTRGDATKLIRKL
jgi:hypothetical protein